MARKGGGEWIPGEKVIEMKSGGNGWKLESVWISKYLLHILCGKGLEQNGFGVGGGGWWILPGLEKTCKSLSNDRSWETDNCHFSISMRVWGRGKLEEDTEVVMVGRKEADGRDYKVLEIRDYVSFHLIASWIPSFVLSKILILVLAPTTVYLDHLKNIPAPPRAWLLQTEKDRKVAHLIKGIYPSLSKWHMTVFAEVEREPYMMATLHPKI